MKKTGKIRSYMKRMGVAAALFAGALFPTAAYAESISPEDYDTKTVDAYLFDKDHKTSMELVFKKDLPEVPYIDITDFLNQFHKKPLSESLQEDGTILVTNNGCTMTVDTENDVMYAPDFAGFFWNHIDQGDDLEVEYLEVVGEDEPTEVKALTLDLGAYGIDLLNIDGKAYIPLPTLSDMLVPVYDGAQYLNDELYFVYTSDLMSQNPYYDDKAVLDQLERSEAEAEFTYNELCFLIDYFFGTPAKTSISTAIAEMGLDVALEEDETLRIAKEYLKSTSNAEYMAGLLYLQIALYDGGHTDMCSGFMRYVDKYPEAPLSAAFISLMKNPDYEGALQVFQLLSNIEAVRETELNTLKAGRFQSFDLEKDLVKAWFRDGTGESEDPDNIIALLFDAGDTMVFYFDSFDHPAVYAFKEAVDYAADHGKKNFIVDISTNGGGYTSVYGYMITLMKNKNRDCNQYSETTYNRTLDVMDETTWRFDLNLDGVFDDKDTAVGYDLNFAVLESKVAFSSGNMLPMLAREYGIAVLGETSGGGECNVNPFLYLSGLNGSISGPNKAVVPSGAVVDYGAEPDYPLVMQDDEGVKDYSQMYDAKLQSHLIHEYYGDYTYEWVDGVWYDGKHKASYEGIGAWTKLADGCWTYKDSLGWYPKNKWQKIDGRWYFFDKNGCMESDAYRNGYYLTKSGAWDEKAATAGWRKSGKGWWYGTGGNTYLKSTWQKIDGKWYYFKADGYAAQNEFVQGWWCNKNCIQSDPVKYGWHRSSGGWWYGAAGGWYAKNATYVIDGAKRTFDRNGYCINP